MILGGAHAGPGDLARFRTEAEAVARLAHPHIVQIYEVGEHAGWAYFALEFVPGGSLARQLAGRPQPASPSARLVEAVARAMAYAHERGVVHRDLKPANILLTADGTPEGHRLRPGQAPRPGTGDVPVAGPHPDGGRPGHPQLHGAGADLGPARGGRPRGRRVRAGGDPVRVPDGPAAVPGGDAPGHPAPGPRRGPGAAAPPGAVRAPRPRHHLSEVLAERATPALPLGRRPGRGLAALPGRRARARGRRAPGSGRSGGRGGGRRPRRWSASARRPS